MHILYYGIVLMSENNNNINSSSPNVSSNPQELNSHSQIELNGFSITSER